MRIIKTLSLTLFFALFFIAGCSKSDVNSPSNNTPTLPTANQSGQPVPAFSGDIAGVLSTIQFDFEVPSPIPLPPVTYRMGFASLNNNDAGSVKVNSTELTKVQQGSVLYYNSFNQTSPADLSSVSFNGSAHSWVLTGAGSIPAFSGSVTSPSAFTLVTPAANATVKKSDGLKLQWTGTSSADSVLIQAVSLDGSGYVLKQNAPNTGTYTFSTTDLGGMTGNTLVQIVKYRYALKTTSSKTFVMVSEIVKGVYVTLN